MGIKYLPLTLLQARYAPSVLKNPPATWKSAKSCPQLSLNGQGKPVNDLLDHLHA